MALAGLVLQAFAVQIKAMVEAGVDIIMLETFTFLSEIKIALQVTKEMFAGPVIASMSFSDEAAEASNQYSPAKVALMLQKWGANVVGVNCGGGWGRVGEGGPAAIYDVAEEMVKAVTSSVPVIALPNGDANSPSVPPSQHSTQLPLNPKTTHPRDPRVLLVCYLLPPHYCALNSRAWGMQPLWRILAPRSLPSRRLYLHLSSSLAHAHAHAHVHLSFCPFQPVIRSASGIGTSTWQQKSTSWVSWRASSFTAAPHTTPRPAGTGAGTRTRRRKAASISAGIAARTCAYV